MTLPDPQTALQLGANAGQRAVEISAVLLSALSGIIVASRKRMDIVGTYALAVVTAFGGGTVRDVLLDRRPLFWVTYWPY
ncbi:MAG: trimeric intracellular cation channel family protein, partial [Gemmatimonadaceae bacterium]